MSWTHYLFGFEGRINRAKMWLFLLLLFACELPLVILMNVMVDLGPNRSVELRSPQLGPALSSLLALFAIAVLYMYGAVAMKRLHDRDKSGWWLLVFLGVPLLLFGAALALMQLSHGHMQPPSTPAFAAFAVLAVIGEGVNLWALVELFCLRGTDGPNRFGADPLAPDHSL